MHCHKSTVVSQDSDGLSPSKWLSPLSGVRTVCGDRRKAEQADAADSNGWDLNDALRSLLFK